ncbi:MAG TPA: hypothetical protein VFG10_08355 [Saprospiraceae bacterium]|nr:hypothetical protein [Saprospiraceae bacterium]
MYDINDDITNTSKYMTDDEKEWRYRASREDRITLEKFKNEYKKQCNSSTLGAVATGFLIYWNEAVSIDVERFWKEAAIRNVEFKRIEPLKYVLANGHFRNIHVILSARQHWPELMNSELIKERYSASEIQQLNSIMENDELTRARIIRKCIKNKNIPMSSAMKLYDTLEYFRRFKLFSKHFSEAEMNEFNGIKLKFELQFITPTNDKSGPPPIEPSFSQN